VWAAQTDDCVISLELLLPLGQQGVYLRLDLFQVSYGMGGCFCIPFEALLVGGRELEGYNVSVN
jgi:hypothetical protein